MDSGAVIGQEAVPVCPRDNVENLKERIKCSEHKLYPRSLDQVCSGEVTFSQAENKVVWK